MIEIKALSSGSKGNCYWITDGSSPLLLECGISIRDIKEGIGFKTSKLAGCLVSHEHGDHAKSVEDLMRVGVDCYMSGGTAEELGISGHRAHKILGDQFTLGTWQVVNFELEHDAAQPLGFMLVNQMNERLVYLTDTFYSRYQFPGMTHLMIECNYSLDILNDNIKSGRVPAVQKKRLLRSHFSLENVKRFLRANDLSQLQEIHLLHLSDRNSDEERFKREIQTLAGKPVYIA